MPFSYDSLNPKFTFFSPVHANLSLADYVDHAIIALDGRAPLAGECALEPLAPVRDAATLRVDLWVEDLGAFNCTYGFLVSSEDGRTPHARGERVVVNVDPRSHAPQPWSAAFRAAHEGLQKDLPAFA